MDSVLYDGFVVITPWKLVGYIGVLCFGMRWVVQMMASHRQKKVTVPMIFWTFTLAGATLQLVYWVWGKNDSVGILQSASPFIIAFYNLYLEITHRRAEKVTPPAPADLAEGGDSADPPEVKAQD
ncbi:MAG: lipid-A-disaccharide synthase N-terminal domain-containing protein [Opitutales bacterium]